MADARRRCSFAKPLLAIIVVVILIALAISSPCSFWLKHCDPNILDEFVLDHASTLRTAGYTSLGFQMFSWLISVLIYVWFGDDRDDESSMCSTKHAMEFVKDFREHVAYKIISNIYQSSFVIGALIIYRCFEKVNMSHNCRTLVQIQQFGAGAMATVVAITPFLWFLTCYQCACKCQLFEFAEEQGEIQQTRKEIQQKEEERQQKKNEIQEMRQINQRLQRVLRLSRFVHRLGVFLNVAIGWLLMFSLADVSTVDSFVDAHCFDLKPGIVAESLFSCVLLAFAVLNDFMFFIPTLFEDTVFIRCCVYMRTIIAYFAGFCASPKPWTCLEVQPSLAAWTKCSYALPLSVFACGLLVAGYAQYHGACAPVTTDLNLDALEVFMLDCTSTFHMLAFLVLGVQICAWSDLFTGFTGHILYKIAISLNQILFVAGAALINHCFPKVRSLNCHPVEQIRSSANIILMTLVVIAPVLWFFTWFKFTCTCTWQSVDQTVSAPDSFYPLPTEDSDHASHEVPAPTVHSVHESHAAELQITVDKRGQRIHGVCFLGYKLGLLLIALAGWLVVSALKHVPGMKNALNPHCVEQTERLLAESLFAALVLLVVLLIDACPLLVIIVLRCFRLLLMIMQLLWYRSWKPRIYLEVRPISTTYGCGLKRACGIVSNESKDGPSKEMAEALRVLADMQHQVDELKQLKQQQQIALKQLKQQQQIAVERLCDSGKGQQVKDAKDRAEVEEQKRVRAEAEEQELAHGREAAKS